MRLDIELDNVSKFYGEILGVNKVHLTIPPGITSLVGPNGSGKTTLMNLISCLLQPTRGKIWPRLPPAIPRRSFRRRKKALIGGRRLPPRFQEASTARPMP